MEELISTKVFTRFLDPVKRIVRLFSNSDYRYKHFVVYIKSAVKHDLLTYQKRIS